MSQKRIKVLSVLGTRPEAVKLAPVIRALQSHPEIESSICITAQHREMLDQVLQVFDIHPDFDLNLMRPDQTLAELTAALFTHLDPVLVEKKPDWIFVQGDTTTVMAAAVNAFYRQIKVGHVEAGLRTFDKWQPFPEEINRRIAGTVADLHFAPTTLNRSNLIKEGVPEEKIVITGNPVIDAVRWISTQPAPDEITTLLRDLEVGSGKTNRLVLITAHRRENFGQPLEQICTAINKLADEYAGKVKFVYPVHLNPNVQQPVYRMLRQNSNITLLPPLDYLPLVHLMRNSTLVLTDSGGIQEEAPGFGIPTLVLRDVTERPEGVDAGVLQLVGTDTDRIIKTVHSLLDDRDAYQKMARAVNPFGDGHAADRIVQGLIDYENRHSEEMTPNPRKIIGIIPNVHGVGGPASFNEKLGNGLRKQGFEVTYDLDTPNLTSVLVIAGTRQLRLLSGLKKKGIPIIQRLDGMNWVHRKRYTGLRYYLRSEVNNWILREIRSKYASNVIYQSEFSRDFWNRTYGSKSTPNCVILNGVDLEQFCPSDSPTLDHDGLNVIAVEGHIKNGLELGLANVIQALNIFSTHSLNIVHLFVAGEVPNEIRIKLAERNKIDITWGGVISRLEIAEQLRRADLFFSAELNPPCPNSVIEAMASGLPVASFESGAIRELVSDDSGIISPYGGNIWNMEPANTELMADMLFEKLRNRILLGKNARTRAVQLFGLDQMVEKYLNVLAP